MAKLSDSFFIHSVKKVEIRKIKGENHDWIQVKADDIEINLFPPIGTDLQKWIDDSRKAFGRFAISGGDAVSDAEADTLIDGAKLYAGEPAEEYVTPTDEDAKSRPEVIVTYGGKETSCVLFIVDERTESFFVKYDDGFFRWEANCRMRKEN